MERGDSVTTLRLTLSIDWNVSSVWIGKRKHGSRIPFVRHRNNELHQKLGCIKIPADRKPGWKKEILNIVYVSGFCVAFLIRLKQFVSLDIIFANRLVNLNVGFCKNVSPKEKIKNWYVTEKNVPEFFHGFLRLLFYQIKMLWKRKLQITYVYHDSL